MMAVKLWFAFGAIKPISELCNSVTLDGESEAIVKGLELRENQLTFLKLATRVSLLKLI